MLKRLLLIIILSLVMAACDDTGDSKDDAEAAQQFFPALAGYNQQGTEGVQDAITKALQGTAISTGNAAQLALVERIDTLLDCYRERGAADAQIYIEDVSALTEVRFPRAGVLAVINVNRAADNLVSCLTEGVSALGATPQPCVNSGSFVFEGDTILYLYAATDQPVCDMFQTHFNQYTPAG